MSAAVVDPVRCAAYPRTGLAVLRDVGRCAAVCPITLCMAGVAIVLHLFEQAGMNVAALELRSAAVAAGSVWSIWTGPLLHNSAVHLAFDVAGLLLVGWAFEPRLRREFPAIIAAVCVGVATAFIAAYPQLEAYRGLSGLAQGLFAAGLVALWHAGQRPSAVLGAGLLVTKWILELAAGASVTAWLATDAAAFGVPVPWTHMAGGLSGGVSAWWLGFFRPPQQSFELAAKPPDYAQDVP